MLVSTLHIVCKRSFWLPFAVSGALMFLLLTIAAVAQPAATLNSTNVWLGSSLEGSLTAGDEITVTINISNVIDLYGAAVMLNFVPADLQVVDDDPGKDGIQITPADCPATDFVVANEANNSIGSIEYSVIQLNPTPPFSGDCTMAHIHFRVQREVTTLVEFNQLLLADPNGETIPTTTTDLSLEVIISRYLLYLPAILRSP